MPDQLAAARKAIHAIPDPEPATLVALALAEEQRTANLIALGTTWVRDANNNLQGTAVLDAAALRMGNDVPDNPFPHPGRA